MDLDASIKKIQTFMNDFHAIFPGGAAGLKEHAAAARAGADVPFVPTPVPTAPTASDTGEISELIEQMKDAIAIGEELRAAWPQIEALAGEIPMIRAQLNDLMGSVAALQSAPAAKPVPAEKEKPQTVWTPEIPASDLGEGERKHGKTGQLFEVVDGHWVPVTGQTHHEAPQTAERSESEQSSA